jgi:hypothetical protein
MPISLPMYYNWYLTHALSHSMLCQYPVHAHPPACVWQAVLNAYTITRHALLEVQELSLQLARHATPLSHGYSQYYK